MSFVQENVVTLQSFLRAPCGEQRGNFEFATVVQCARNSAVLFEQPRRRRRIAIVHGVARWLSGNGFRAQGHHANVAGHVQRYTATIGRAAFGGMNSQQQRVTKALRFGPDGIHIGIDRDVARAIAKIRMIGMQVHRRGARVVRGERLGLGVGSLRQQSQLLQEFFHTLRFNAKRFCNVINWHVAVLEHVGRRTDGGNAIAERVCYAA